MEDPREEIADVINGLVNRLTFKQQEETVKKYFSHDATFYHEYAHGVTGVSSLVDLYQVALFLANYQGVLIRYVIYDSESNSVAVQMTVIGKPWIGLWRSLALELFTLFQLEDVSTQPDGKTIKKIKSQQDYFYTEPVLQVVPIIGPIYRSNLVKAAMGEVITRTWRMAKSAYLNVVPDTLQELAFSIWQNYLLVPPMEQFRMLKAFLD